MKIKQLSIFITMLGLIIIAVGYYVFSKPSLDLKTNKIILEYGEELMINVDDLVTVSDQKILNTIDIDLNSIEFSNNFPNIGNYSILIHYKIRNKKQTDKIILEVVDTTAPEFVEFKEVIEITNDQNNINYLDYFKAEDLSEFEIIVNDDLVIYNEINEYLIEVKAIDIYGNENIKNAIIKIIDKPNNNHSGELYYVDDILIVNKKHPLPANYAPGENSTAGNAIRKMIADMQLLGYDISNSYSGYRSYLLQETLYNNYVNSYGKKQADTFSARPGYSEHQTGLTFDLKHSDGTLVTKANEADWIAQNAHLYGFIVRYQPGKEAITGYMPEPWHLRYIGDKAEDIYLSGKSLEEYLGVEGGEY